MQYEAAKFSDPSDRASHEEQASIHQAVEAVKLAAAAPKLAAIGECHNCGEPLSAGERFCDADCRDDYQHRLARRRANLGVTP